MEKTLNCYSIWLSWVSPTRRKTFKLSLTSIADFFCSPANSAPKPWYAHSSLERFINLFVSSAWAIATNQSEQVFGVTIGGEFSTAINPCGLWRVCSNGHVFWFTDKTILTG